MDVPFLQNFGWKAARPASLRINLASANMATGFYCNCFETTKNHTLIRSAEEAGANC